MAHNLKRVREEVGGENIFDKTKFKNALLTAAKGGTECVRNFFNTLSPPDILKFSVLFGGEEEIQWVEEHINSSEEFRIFVSTLIEAATKDLVKEIVGQNFL